jgi:hypothetical protein
MRAREDGEAGLVSGDGLLQVIGPVAAGAIQVGAAQVVLRQRPVVPLLRAREDGEGSLVRGDGLFRVAVGRRFLLLLREDATGHSNRKRQSESDSDSNSPGQFAPHASSPLNAHRSRDRNQLINSGFTMSKEGKYGPRGRVS